MKKASSILVILCLLVFTVALPNTTDGQNYIEDIDQRDIELTLDPPTPGTNEDVRAEVDSLLVDVNRMLITWFVNGEIVASGYGITEVDLTTGDQGEITSLEAYIQIDGAAPIRKWARIAPADLDILWEANTYVPPFYRGKALPTPESHITVVGIPNVRNQGAQALENNMVFNWSVNGKNMSEESGFAKNPLVIRNDFLRRSERVELEVIHRDGLTRASRSTTIPISQTEVVVYEKRNFLRVANGYKVAARGEDLTLIAEPYYFSTKSELLNLLEYNWFVNGEVVLNDTSKRKNELFARAQENGLTSEIGIQVKHTSKPLQRTDILNFNVIQ